MNEPAWVKTYFGKKVKDLSPTVVEEGKRYAIVRIQDMGQKGEFSKVGFILVLKNGRYGASPHDSLFEGSPTVVDLFTMKNKLEKKEDS